MSSLDPFIVISSDLSLLNFETEDSDTVEQAEEGMKFCSVSEKVPLADTASSEFGLNFLLPSPVLHLTLIRTDEDFQFELTDFSEPFELPFSSEICGLFFFLITE